jgi:coniferyl-aldehyde dehydrogenase
LVDTATGPLLAILERQRAAFAAEGEVSAAARRERLQRCINVLRRSTAAITASLEEDFGQRPAAITQFADVFPAVAALDHARRHVTQWMRPTRHAARIGMPVPGARAEVIYQPLGVVGIVSPWNFPINLTFAPLAGALAAGNRCMIKPSEHTPATSALLARLISQEFDPAEIAVCTGSAEAGAAFTQLPFDHLLFTGSTSVGRRVMAAAANNLVPVTLELGGKCPAIVSRSAKLERAVDRILLAKLANAGQICLAPDYVLLPREHIDSFIAAARAWHAATYGQPNAVPTAVINDHHIARLQGYLDDARANGAEVIELAGAGRASAVNARLMNLHLVRGVQPSLRMMQEEIFGPVLPLVPYEDIEDALDFVRRRPRPLALYWFGADRREEHAVLNGSLSGGVTINDVAMHTLIEDLPFGGVGASGIGAYHGEHGFRTFSHARAVYRQTPLDIAGLMGLRPPYSARTRWALKFLLGK